MYGIAFFGITAVILPVLTSMLGLTLGLPLIFSYLMFRWFCGSLIIMTGVPTVVSALFWSLDKATHKRLLFLVQVMLPLSCFLIFVTHVVGQHAWGYALYWLIPVLLYLLSNNSIFSKSLSSTLLAHAVGSIIWLYTVPMTAEQWIALIPLVALERLTFAIAGTVMFYAVRVVMNIRGISGNK